MPQVSIEEPNLQERLDLAEEISFNQVQTLLLPIAAISRARSAKAKHPYTLIYRGLPTRLKSLEDAIGWFHTYGQVQTVVGSKTWEIHPEYDSKIEPLPEILAIDVQSGQAIRTPYCSDGFMQVEKVITRNNLTTSLELIVKGCEQVAIYSNLWKFQVLETNQEVEF